MKDSDIKKERIKKGMIVSGIAVGAAASTAGAAYAATQAFSDDAELPEEETPSVENEIDVDVEYPEPIVDEPQAASHTTYTTVAHSQPVAAAPELDQASVVTPEAAPTDEAFADSDDVELMDDFGDVEDIMLEEFVAPDTFVSNPVNDDLSGVYESSFTESAQADLTEIYESDMITDAVLEADLASYLSPEDNGEIEMDVIEPESYFDPDVL